jgi:hypothetical protein
MPLQHQRVRERAAEIVGRQQNELRSSSLTKIRGIGRYERFGCDRCSLELAVPPKE